MLGTSTTSFIRTEKLVLWLIALGLCACSTSHVERATETEAMGSRVASGTATTANGTAGAYMRRHPELAQQKRLTVHYTSPRREAFWIKAADYELKFNMTPPGVGVSLLQAAGKEQSLIAQGLNLRVTAANGTVYESARAAAPARLNIFRHGPHYYDARVYDLLPTSAAGDTLGVRGEVVFHAYPERLYMEVELHGTADVAIASAEAEWTLNGESYDRYLTNEGASDVSSQTAYQKARPEPHAVLGVAGRQGIFGLILPDSAGTSELALVEDAGRLHLTQKLSLKKRAEKTREGNARWSTGDSQSLHARLFVDDAGGFSNLRSARVLEANPLDGEAFDVKGDASFKGYNSRRGHYTVATRSGQSVSYFYEHPQYMAVAPLSITNDGRARKIYVKHEDALHAGRIEAGIVTDTAGFALPVLVQGSKNFSGEDEEPFYNPGDPAYNESYFPLILSPQEELELRSYHAFQNWGNHPLKQISSLQAWMPYYQMTVGVTETTCYVPFRFGGAAPDSVWTHPVESRPSGIWAADLRGVSGTQWEDQPQYDNVGGHRFFHYRTGGESHYLRYLRSRFVMTSPNLALWGMDYVTEEEEANVHFRVFEAPQQDQTRNFTTMRIDFEEPLRIENPAENLHLVSIDTRTQQLRYETVGYIGEDGELVERSTNDRGQLPQGAVLAKKAPLVGMYRVTPESNKHGNNALLVRDFEGTIGGTPVERLAVTVDTLGEEDLMLSLTLPGEEAVQFEPGDYLELDLMLTPYGKVGEGFEAPLTARRHYGLNPPRVNVTEGKRVEHFPSRVRVTPAATAAFSIEGGNSVIPVLVEGFRDYHPPRLEVKREGGWKKVEMTAQGNEGHHTYLTEDRRYGFVFLADTDGSEMQFRIRQPEMR